MINRPTSSSSAPLLRPALLLPSALLLASVANVMLASGSALEAQARRFTAEDMLDVVRISGRIAVSPAGDWIAYVLPDLDADSNVAARLQAGTVFVQHIGGAAIARAVAIGTPGGRSSFPVFSPDGTRLALYLENLDGGQGGRLAVWDVATGDTKAVGARFAGRATSAPEWASSDRVVYARPAAEQAPAEPARTQVLESTDAVLPGDAFFANRRRSGLAVIDLATGVERALLADDEALRGFSVSPDGRHSLVAVPRPGTEGVPRGERNETFVMSLDDESEPRKITNKGERVSWAPNGDLLWREARRLVTLGIDQPGPAEGGAARPFIVGDGARITTPLWSSDGTRIASLVEDPSLSDPEIEPRQPGMYSIARPFMDLYLISANDIAGNDIDGNDIDGNDIDQTNIPEDDTPGTDHGTTNITSEIEHQISSPVWSDDGSALFFRAVDNGTYDETLYRYDIARQRLSVLAEGKESYGNLMPVPGGLLLAIQSATTPSDLWLIDAESGERTRITDLNPQLAEFEFSEPELLHFDNADGERLGALLYRATGVGGEPAPVITYVYEKLTPGIHRFSMRHQIFATHGYSVLMPNVKVKVGETGTSFVKSVVPAVAMVREMGITNGRVCLWGGSFGAYATSFVITQTNIFDCAVSRATPPELFRNWASGRDRDSDNIESGQARMGGSPFEVQERYLSQSAFFHLDQVETPVLLMHGVEDYTILVGEGEMMFYALRRLGKEATLVLYREGDHSLYRRSRADALDVHERMLAWFDRYLRDDGELVGEPPERARR